AGDVDHMEMYNIFNMGIGMVVAVPADRVDEVMNLLDHAGEAAYRIGAVVKKSEADVELI
ncbi:AIR synthase-related protein, partial [uncultured Bifidobacterium sp.]|uniref:AIR synthase-related protein n=1 Tax=uncultured Bifidobacterium sp. TaxID=165187 RepID=UPI00258556F5